jgi:polar amino acid transport system substrate-binding protein
MLMLFKVVAYRSWIDYVLAAVPVNSGSKQSMTIYLSLILKKLKRFSSLSLPLILLFFMAPIKADDTISQILKRGVLRVGLEAGYVPFEMKDKQGRLIGFDVDLANMIAREMGVKVELINTEWDGMIPSLITRKFDLVAAGMTLTQQRNLKVNFSDPYIEIGQTVLIRKDLAKTIKSYKDLNQAKWKISSKLGTSGELAAKKYLPKAQYRAYQTEQEAVMEVVNGRVDAFVYDAPYNIIYAGGKGKGTIHHLPETFTYEPIAFAVTKGDPDFLNWLNNFIRQIKKDGRYQKVYEAWFKETDWLKKIQD